MLKERSKGMCDECEAHRYTVYLLDPPKEKVTNSTSTCHAATHTRSRTQKDMGNTKNLDEQVIETLS
jgi:hypothetical protein